MTCKKYSNYEVAYVVDADPVAAVIAALKRRDRRNTRMLSLLQCDWPAAQAIIERLSLLIGDGIRADEQPVIYSIIETALHRYASVVFHENSQKAEDPARIGAFLEAIITETCRSLAIEVVGSSGQVWSIHSGKPFAHWLYEQSGELKVQTTRFRDQEVARQRLYALLTNDSVRAVLRKAGYEEAVVAGRLAAGA